jgi:diguanylate cyclase (GGDEF)-like protein
VKVLIVDDSEDALRLARQRLASENVDIACARTGQEGLELVRAEKPDLVLLDVNMPGMSGFDVCREIKSDGDICGIPVVFLSGSGGTEDRVKGLDLGAVDFVTKPFDAFELRARVRAALRTKALQDMLAEQAQIDPLTGLANRRGLHQRLSQEWARTQRQGGTLSLIMADIDHFKRINDAFGHPVGDSVLQAVAGVLKHEAREMDFPARHGGEEFTILVPGASVAEAGTLAERCRAGIEALSRPHNGQQVRATASLGVASSVGHTSWEELVAAADDALYRAKRSGRNRVEIVEPVSA